MTSFSSVLDEIRNFEPTKLPAKEQPLIIYGAGGFGRDVAKALLGQGYTVLGFLDRRGSNEVEGIPCRTLEADLSDWLARDATVLVGLHNYQVDPLPIRKELLGLGFRRVLLTVEYFGIIESKLGVRYWLGQRGIYRNHLEELKALHDSLADEKSRALLQATLEYRALSRPEAQPVAQPDESYFPTDIPRWTEPLNWVDGGACDGDSLRAFPLDRYHCGNVYAFEPDPINYEKLQGALRDFQQRSPQTQVDSWPCGLGKEPTILKFKTGLGLGSAASVEGETECRIVPLDDTLAGRPVNFIKLDIEGAEPDALLGAEQIIREQKPGLAVCIYHTPAHLWEIPLQMAQRHPGYHFYLRCHGHSSFDLVLYAVRA